MIPSSLVSHTFPPNEMCGVASSLASPSFAMYNDIHVAFSNIHVTFDLAEKSRGRALYVSKGRQHSDSLHHSVFSLCCDCINCTLKCHRQSFTSNVGSHNEIYQVPPLLFSARSKVLFILLLGMLGNQVDLH